MLHYGKSYIFYGRVWPWFKNYYWKTILFASDAQENSFGGPFIESLNPILVQLTVDDI